MKKSPLDFLFVPSLILVSLCFSLPACAQLGAIQPPENLLQLDFRISYFDYNEDLPPPNKSTETGWLPGAAVSWTRTRPGSVYARTFLEFSSGDIEYDGTTQNGMPITNSNSNQFLFRVEANVGYTFRSGDLIFSPYTGFGYRYWKRGDSEVIQMGQVNVGFVREDYQWMYVPLGLRAVYPFGGQFSVEPNAAVRFMFWGRMTAYLTDIGYGSDPTFDLGNKPGWVVEIPIRYRVSRNWSLSLTPWYEYSAIGQSDVVPVRNGPFTEFFYEPSSRTHQFGFNLGAGYIF